MQQQTPKDYARLLQEFTSYKQQSITEKQQMKKQLEKCKQTLQKLNSKLQKRVQAKIKEERNVNNHRLEELEETHTLEINKIKTLLAQKDKITEELRDILRNTQIEKRELAQNNIQMLVELSQTLEIQQQKPSQTLDHNYRDLTKMYQFLIEENNELKKEIYRLKKTHLNTSSLEQSFLPKEQKSLNHSDYKPKSAADSTKGKIPTLPKSQQQSKDRSDRPKQKGHGKKKIT